MSEEGAVASCQRVDGLGNPNVFINFPLLGPEESG